jgi:levanbiose-producing levanase
MRSSQQNDIRRLGAGDVARPDCITAEAVQAMLGDLGWVDRTPVAGTSTVDRNESSLFRPAYHITPDQHWMNDPQRPFFLNGLWHYYYLYNADYPNGNGTEWFHLTSPDLVTWKDEGVAISKYTNGLGDVETGSAVVDHHNTAGFGKDAVIAVVTQQDAGIQRQSLFYSTNGGYSFTAYEGNPVMENPGQEHWRDPKVLRDDANSQWLMVLAEGSKLGMYTSQDLGTWRYASSVELPGLGILECPDLFQLDLDGDPSRRTWVLAASANGAAEGRTTGVAYWTGTWDGHTFTPSSDRHQWLDGGSDFYAAVTWDDPRLTESQRMQSRQAMGWVNNWDYARKLPTVEWQGGMDSIVRDIRLKTVQGKATLISTPEESLARLEGESETAGPEPVSREGTPGLPTPKGGAYRLDLTLERSRVEDLEGGKHPEALLQLARGGSVFATVAYDFGNETASVSREQPPGTGADLGREFAEKRSVTARAREGAVDLTVLVDHSSVEVFVNGGEQTLTSLVFPKPGESSLKIVSEAPGLTVSHVRHAPLLPSR